MDLDKIFFGIFTMSTINLQNNKPEQGQNYDTNNIVRFQYRMFEMKAAEINDQKGSFQVNPLRLNILNLVNTSGLEQEAPMQSYRFVNKDIVSSMDGIADKIKDEIVNMTKKREAYFQ